MKIIKTILVAGILSYPAAGLAGGLAAPEIEAAPQASGDVGQLGADWTGFYLGAHRANYNGSASSIVSGNLAFTFDGSIPGVHFGYDHDFGRLVVGGEVAGDFGEIGYHLISGAAAPFSLDRMVSLKVKVGVDLGKFLVYGTAGVARAEVGDTSGLLGTEPGSADGTLYGIGAAAMLTDQLFVSTEIVKMTFDPYEGAATFDSEATAVSLRLSYRF